MLTATDVRAARFTATKFRQGYEIAEVDAFLERAARTLEHLEQGGSAAELASSSQDADGLLTPQQLQDVRFSPTHLRAGYYVEEVDDLLDEVIDTINSYALSGQAPAEGGAAASEELGDLTDFDVAAPEAAPLDDAPLDDAPLDVVAAEFGEQPYPAEGYAEQAQPTEGYSEATQGYGEQAQGYGEAPYDADNQDIWQTAQSAQPTANEAPEWDPEAAANLAAWDSLSAELPGPAPETAPAPESDTAFGGQPEVDGRQPEVAEEYSFEPETPEAAPSFDLPAAPTDFSLPVEDDEPGFEPVFAYQSLPGARGKHTPRTTLSSEEIEALSEPAPAWTQSEPEAGEPSPFAAPELSDSFPAEPSAAVEPENVAETAAEEPPANALNCQNLLRQLTFGRATSVGDAKDRVTLAGPNGEVRYAVGVRKTADGLVIDFA